jgi:hypothetical protein
MDAVESDVAGRPRKLATHALTSQIIPKFNRLYELFYWGPSSSRRLRGHVGSIARERRRTQGGAVTRSP